MSRRWSASCRSGTGGRSRSRRGTGRRSGPSGCSTARPGTPSPRWGWCAGSRWRGWMRRPAGGAGGAAWGSGRSMRPARSSRAVRTAGVKRQYLGCVGKVANGITTVHLSYVRERTGHALIGARQWIPAEQIDDPVRSLVMGLPLDLVFRTKGQLAIDICHRGARRRGPAGLRLRGRGLRQPAPSCASSWKTTARAMCCGSPPASASRWPAGSR